MDRIRLLVPGDPAVLLGPGDDAAVIRRPRSDLAVTTDLLVEGVDFLPGEDLERVGRRAVSVNASDLAAMGASPRFLLLSLGLPAVRGEEDALAIVRGAAARASEFGAALVGGDVSRASCLVVSVAMWGELASPPLLRSGARSGDALYLTGWPGRAAAGLGVARRRASGGTVEATPSERELLAAYRDPEPRLAIGASLAARSLAHAAIDVSDGVGRDAGRLALASGLRVVLERRLLPVSSALASEAVRQGVDPIDWILGGGDDYELLFAAAEAASPEIVALGGGVAITRIGHFEEGTGAILRDETEDRDISGLGHDHFEAAT